MSSQPNLAGASPPMSPVAANGPLASRAPGRVMAWWLALRPATLAVGAGPVLVGTALAATVGRIEFAPAAAALAGALLLQIASNLYNDYADYQSGADGPDRLGPPRAAQQGWIAPTSLRNGALIALALTAVLGVYLSTLGGWPILVLGLSSMVAALAYTGGPYPLAYRGLGDLFVLLFFGFGAVVGSYFLQTKSVTPTAILVGGAVGSLATAVLCVNNLRDRRSDARAHKRTLVVRFGETFGRRQYASLVFAPYLLMGVLTVETNQLVWLAPLLSLPLAVRQWSRVQQCDGAALNPHLGATARLGSLFNILLAAALGWQAVTG